MQKQDCYRGLIWDTTNKVLKELVWMIPVIFIQLVGLGISTLFGGSQKANNFKVAQEIADSEFQT
jgi:hypothetical protein